MFEQKYIQSGSSLRSKGNRYRKPPAKVKIEKTWSQRIFDVTEEEAKAEEFKNLADFLERWKKINEYLIPWQTVIAYEFKMIKL